MLHDTRYDICPSCGGQKRTVASICKKCQRQSQNKIDQIPITQDIEWIIEFAGLFCGEGSALIVRNNSSYSPVLSLRLRDDDHLVVEDIRSHLGGRLLHRYLHNKNPKHGNQLEWRETNLERCELICRLLIVYSVFPSKKKNDIEQLFRFILWRKSIGYHFTKEQREEAEFQLQSLRKSRIYSF